MKIKNKLDYKNVAALVKVEGLRSPCYSTFVDKKKKNMSCWITSEENKNFSVKVYSHEKNCSLQVDLYLDGRWTGRKYLKNGDKASFTRIWTSNMTYRPFIFAPLQVTDNDAYLDTALLTNKKIQNIGEISLTVRRVTNLRITPVPIDPKPKESIPKLCKVHEQSIKASTMPHQIAYGEKIHVDEHTYNQATCDIKETIATFTFRYRPLEALRACGLAAQPFPRKVILPHENIPSGELPAQQEQITPTEHVPQLSDEQDGNSATPLLPLEPSPDPQVEPDKFEDVMLRLPDHKNIKLEPKREEMKIEANNDDDDDDEDEDDDEDDEILKALQELQAKVPKHRENKKRKKREAAESRLRKKLKLEPGPLAFFAPGETKEVIDLT